MRRSHVLRWINVLRIIHQVLLQLSGILVFFFFEFSHNPMAFDFLYLLRSYRCLFYFSSSFSSVGEMNSFIGLTGRSINDVLAVPDIGIFSEQKLAWVGGKGRFSGCLSASKFSRNLPTMGMSFLEEAAVYQLSGLFFSSGQPRSLSSRP